MPGGFGQGGIWRISPRNALERWARNDLLTGVGSSPVRAVDVHGNVYVNILARNAVVRVNADDQAQEGVAALGSSGPIPSAHFDLPASLAFGTGTGEQQNLFVTNVGSMVRYIPSPHGHGLGLPC